MIELALGVLNPKFSINWRSMTAITVSRVNWKDAFPSVVDTGINK